MLVKVYKVSCRALLLATAFGLYAASPAMSQNPPPAVIAPAPEQGADVPEYPQAVPVDSKVQPLIPTPPAVEPVAAGEQIPIPEARELAAPNAVPPRPSPEPGVNAPAIPDATQSSEFNENLFFDAEQIVPEGELAKKGAPSKVDPSVNPGSSLVITTTEHGASTKEAQLVAAERAHVLGRYESALEIYNNLYVSNKRDPNILFGRALSLQSLGRDEEAISAYEELLDIRPKNLEAQINMQGLIGKRYPAVALRALQDLYQDNPSSTALVSQVSIMEAQLGHYEEAIRFLGMAASMEPQNAGHLFNMAIIADRAGDKKAAVKYYEDALETDTLYGSNRSIPRESVYQRLAELR